MAASLTVNENGLLVSYAAETTTKYSKLGTSGFATYPVAGFTESWQGTNLRYSDGLIPPVGGNLNRVTVTKNGTPQWDFNGFTVPINGAITFDSYILKVIEQGTVLNVYGGRGNDKVTAFATTEVVDGFGGIDTMLLSGPLSVFTADNFSDGTLVLAVPGESASALVKNVEYFEFTDQTLSYSELESLYSPPAATFRLSASAAFVNEGSTATFTLSTTNVAAGTAVGYTVSGVSSVDIVGGVMSGTATVGSNGQATISVPLAADNLTEGTETLTVTAQGKSASVTINDTSTGTAKSESSSIPQGNYTLNVIVDLFGQVLNLKGLKETVTSTSHTVEHAGTTFNWSEVDSFVTTVTRDGSFTDEFAKEIVDAYPSVAGISYATAVALVGASAIDSVLIAVAGADGNYVG